MSESWAIIPVMFLWDDGTEACNTWDDKADTDDGHRETLHYGNPNTHCRPDPWTRFWLSERRTRWLHDAQVRG